MNSPGRYVPNMLLEKCGEITPERMTRQSQSENNTVMDVTGDGSKVQCCKEQYCIGTWNIRTMNQEKLEVVKQEMESEYQHFRNQWTKKDRVQNAVNGYNLKNDRMISVRLQGKPFSITVIQVYVPTINVKEAEQFYENL